MELPVKVNVIVRTVPLAIRSVEIVNAHLVGEVSSVTRPALTDSMARIVARNVSVERVGTCPYLPINAIQKPENVNVGLAGLDWNAVSLVETVPGDLVVYINVRVRIMELVIL